MTNVVYHNPPTALPLDYDIRHVPASPDWIYELRWRGQSLDTFYSIGDAVEAGLSHVSFVDGGYFEADCEAGDMHIYTPEEQWEVESGAVEELEIAMLDSCLNAFYSEAEAGGIMLSLEERGIHVRPAQCKSCLRWHLERGR